MKEQLSLRYPIGMFEYGKEYSNMDTLRQIREIANLPKKLKKIVKKLREGALDKTYRQHGWTVRQVIHHLADSHINAYIRMKLAITENAPIVKPYEEQLWAETEDGKHGSVGISLKLLSALHKRWVFFLSHLSDEDLDRVYYNPSSKRTIQVREAIALYTWHGKHHLAHVKLVAGSTGKHETGETEVVEVKTRRVAKSGSSKAVTGKVAGDDISGEAEATKRRGRPPLAKPAAKPASQPRKKGAKTASGVSVESLPEAVSEVSPDKPKRGRPAVNKSAMGSTVESQSEVVSAVSSDKPKRGRPAVSKTASPEKPKRGRRTAEEIAADKGKKG